MRPGTYTNVTGNLAMIAVPGTPGLMHRIGGLEKADETGSVSYDPANHERMCRARAAKIAGIAGDIPDVAVDADDGAELFVLGWGSTYGAIGAAVRRVRSRGGRIAWAHLTHLNPFPANLGDVARRYPKVLVPELNLGQLTRLVRAEYLIDARPLSMVRACPSWPPTWRRSSSRSCPDDRPGRARHHAHHDEEGLDRRPGGEVVPRLWRLHRPDRRADAHA